jgi:hypothetical protein
MEGSYIIIYRRVQLSAVHCIRSDQIEAPASRIGKENLKTSTNQTYQLICNVWGFYRPSIYAALSASRLRNTVLLHALEESYSMIIIVIMLENDGSNTGYPVAYDHTVGYSAVQYVKSENTR